MSVTFNELYKRLGSVAGPVIQATGRSEFEDVLGAGDFVSGYSYHMSIRTRGLIIWTLLSSFGLRGRRRTYHTILKLEDHALFNTVWYVFLRPLRPELDNQDSA
jgi:hypothetical protein